MAADCWYRRICRRPVPPRYLESQFEQWQKFGCALVGWVGALVLVVLALAAAHEGINAFDPTTRWYVWSDAAVRTEIPPISFLKLWRMFGCAPVGWVGALVLVVSVLGAVHGRINAFGLATRGSV